MLCFICNADVTTLNGFNEFNILCSELPSGALLSSIIGRTLKRDVDSGSSRSTNLCKRCFSLFNELDIAENRCLEIKREIGIYYSKTCQMYNDDHFPGVYGVGCQTDDSQVGLLQTENERIPDIKLKIPVPKRRRGRPVKTQTQPKKRQAVIDTPNPSEEVTTTSVEKPRRREKQIKKEEADIIENQEVTEIRRTRSSGRNNGKRISTVVDIEKSEVKHEKTEVEEEKSIDKIFDDLDANSIKEDENSRNDGEKIVQNAFNDTDDDDDFEWKEEPANVMNDDSCDSESEVKDEHGNDDDWQSSGSKDSKKKHKKKKKRKRGDRRGERAFMVPIHECSQCGKKWRTVTELKSHIASHSDVRPFVCEICGQAYKMKKALDIHIGMHNGIHPFVCSYCNKSFTQKVGLEKHLPIHTGVTRFQCDLCGKRFIHQKSFNIHKMTHTGKKIFIVQYASWLCSRNRI